MAGRCLLVLLSMCCGLIGSPVNAVAQSQRVLPKAAPRAADKEGVKRGEAVFNKYCPICHLGRPSKTNPFIGRNLRGILKNGKPEQEVAVREFIRKGSDKMPGFQYNLTPGQLEDLIGYLKTYN
jgi:mono/diheme cytochrome c family protein